MRVSPAQWPHEWDKELLATTCEIEIGRTPPRDRAEYWHGTHTWISITDMSSRIVTTSKDKVTDKAIEDNQVRLVKKGTLLLSFKLTIGKVAFAGEDLFTNEAIAAISIREEFKNRLLPEFLYWALQAVPLEGEADLAVKGKTLNKKKMMRIQVPLPPPAEQRRIVARIETLFEELREMRRLNDAIKEDTGRLMGAVLGEVFSDLVAKYECVTIKQLKQQEVLSITGGGTPSTEKTEYWTGSIPWASPKDMKTWLIGDTQKHVTQEAIEESSAKRVKAGSILVVVRGMILARTWPVAIARVELAINQDMKALTPCGELDERFLGYMLRALTPEVLERVETAAHGTKRLPSDVLEALEIPLPERTVQKRIAVYLENVEWEIRAMQNIQADDEQALQHVEQAILMKAFRGEL